MIKKKEIKKTKESEANTEVRVLKESDGVKEEKPKKESLESRLEKRKEYLKTTFLKCLKDNHPKSKFDYHKYLCGTGGKGILCEVLKDYNVNDRRLFQEILQELKKDKTLYHIGGCMYVLN